MLFAIWVNIQLALIRYGFLVSTTFLYNYFDHQFSSVFSLLTVVTIGLNAIMGYHSAVIANHNGCHSMASAGFELTISPSAVRCFTIWAIAPFLDRER